MSFSLFNPGSWFSGSSVGRLPIPGAGYTRPVTNRYQLQLYQTMVAIDREREDLDTIMETPVKTKAELEKWQAAYARERLLEEARANVIEEMHKSHERREQRKALREKSRKESAASNDSWISEKKRQVEVFEKHSTDASNESEWTNEKIQVD